MYREFPFFESCSLSPYSKDEIYLEHFSRYIRSNQKLNYPHRHSFYHLVFFIKGNGQVGIDHNSFDIKPNQIYFMLPGQLQTYFCEEDVEGYVINFSFQFFNSFLLKVNYLDQFPYFKGTMDNPVIQIPEAMQQHIIILFERMFSEAAERKRLDLDMVKVLMLQLFIHIGRITNQTEQEVSACYKMVHVKKFLNLIETNLLNLKLPKDYAQMLHITTNHLNSLCNEILGKSTGEVIRERLITEAKRLMINHELSISEVAYRLNFNDNSYFTKFFKKHTDMTPEAFRQNIFTGQVFRRVLSDRYGD
ncbi:MAG: helix-turn-helix domain-containing protein [Acinetobacter sp.]|nr:MAG: helix-turn-helix domain-containing protein [Acinetobacter sp.]